MGIMREIGMEAIVGVSGRTGAVARRGLRRARAAASGWRRGFRSHAVQGA